MLLLSKQDLLAHTFGRTSMNPGTFRPSVLPRFHSGWPQVLPRVCGWLNLITGGPGAGTEVTNHAAPREPLGGGRRVSSKEWAGIARRGGARHTRKVLLSPQFADRESEARQVSYPRHRAPTLCAASRNYIPALGMGKTRPTEKRQICLS